MAANRNSLVAYFDILGYQSFLKTNSDLETAENVFHLVKNAPKNALASWSELELTKTDEDFKQISKSIQSLVFSDTIVVSCPISEIDNSDKCEKHIAFTAAIAAHITLSMFNAGLPVRGVITHGSFIFAETCIAGHAVVDAHQLCQSLDLAGTAFSPELSALIDKYYEVDKIWNSICPYYLLPLKNGSELKTRSVSWINLKGDSITEVRESFWKWNKDIPGSVDRKVHNTAKMIDFFRMLDEQEEKKAKKS
jgi:hypothetical protein